MMSTQLSVSVVIATNRGGEYLAEAVASVRSQTVGGAEIILVDDGSGVAGLRELAEADGLRYVSQEASGVSVARNRGAAHAVGDLLAFLDDDDVWHPDRIAEQLHVLSARPDALASFTGGWFMDAVGDEFGDGWSGTTATREEWLRGDVPIPRINALLVRREDFLALGGFSRHFRIAEDNELILRLIQHGILVGVNKRLVGYRRHPASVTSLLTQKRAQVHQRVVTLQQWGAQSRGDDATAAMLDLNRRRILRHSADVVLGRLVASTRSGQGGAVPLRELGWLTVRAPQAVVGATWSRGTRAVGRRVLRRGA